MAKFTIFIGEQASGKSVLSKLLYFFNDAIFHSLFQEREVTDIAAFQDFIESEFKSWFPPSAWGDGRFCITFQAAGMIISIRRKNPRSKNLFGLIVEFSDDFLTFYNSYKKAQQKAEDEIAKLGEVNDSPFRQFELQHTVQRQFTSDLKKQVGADYVGWQLFIPAGRSFFTSLGKAISAFERSGMLDPITMRFGEFYLSAKQRLSGKTLFYPRPKIDMELKSVMKKFFGGEIIFKKEEEFVKTTDDRLIPIAYLSSGQQELLPLWLSIEETLNYRGQEYNIYIEEPEAHIFPSTQSMLIEYLSAFLGRKSENSRVVLTTHSPYVLAKFNNLIKAGSVGSRRGKATRVGEIVSKDAWLRPGGVAAYSIDGGLVSSIIDSDGLIDADFLDGVSGLISEEYMKLVKIECSR